MEMFIVVVVDVVVVVVVVVAVVVVFSKVAYRRFSHVPDFVVINDIDSEVLSICDVVLHQKYFYCSVKYYTQKDGLAIGKPTYSILSEFCLQYLEHTSNISISNRRKVLVCF